MTFEERSRLIRRISTGKFITNILYKNNRYKITFSDPDSDVIAEADYIYDATLEECRDRQNIPTLEESYQLLTEQGKWTPVMENGVKQIEKDIIQLKKELQHNKHDKKYQLLINETIKNGEIKLTNLLHTKNQLWTSTADYLADKARKRYIMSNIVRLEDPSLLLQPSFIDTLIVCYYKDSVISEPQIRELARTDPWRLFWLTAKNTGSSLFVNPTTSMSDSQYLLVLWSRVYDFAYESTSRPSEDVISNDVQFDEWYKAEIDKIDRENTAAQYNVQNGHGTTEVFVPSNQDAAGEVHKLNDPITRSKLHKRYDYINKKGMAREEELPDVQSALRAMILSGTQGRV